MKLKFLLLFFCVTSLLLSSEINVGNVKLTKDSCFLAWAKYKAELKKCAKMVTAMKKKGFLLQ